MRNATMSRCLGVMLLVLGACGDDPLAPFSPEIANLTDNFQFQATGLSDVSTTVEYMWQNTGTTANINQSSVVSGGTAMLTVYDAASPRVQVYNRTQADNGTFVTATGTTGMWLIRVTLTDVTGTLNFRAQKP
jgi:hypothetical protein